MIPVAETTSYSIAKLENGVSISDYALDEQLAETIIMDVMVKSAAWEGIDINTLKECYRIRQTFLHANENHDYYVYLLEDSTAVMQAGTDGRYSVLSKELYLELLRSWETLTKDVWSDNQYTEGVPRPDFGTILWAHPDDEKGYYAVCYQEVNRGQIEEYLKTLTNGGWQIIRDFYEDTTVGGLYEKDNHTISIQFAGENMVLYFSLK